MPRIQKVLTIDVTPEKFLNACDPQELMELEILLGSENFQQKIRNHMKLNSPKQIKE